MEAENESKTTVAKETPLADDTASDDNDFHDAEDSDGVVLEDKFSDALDLNAVPEPELSEEEMVANKLKSDTIKQNGNDVFKTGDYEKAIELYTEAIELCPKQYTNERSILFNNRAAAHKHLDAKNVAIDDCTQAIELNPEYVKAFLRRAALYEEADKLNESLDDYKKVLELDASNVEARSHVVRLTPIVEERNERLKAEMMGKLKDLGNMILKPFGLSTNNFQLQQDPNTGSYSVNFNQGAGK